MLDSPKRFLAVAIGAEQTLVRRFSINDLPQLYGTALWTAQRFLPK
ncbi:MAG: hypothetical protein HC881_02165 [Leptolyngbyaceae cyanobacterium SL_7_1]|nr:hypothetical protein [Leptolyngbyaceae cyanobacterium SL_7_1]